MDTDKAVPHRNIILLILALAQLMDVLDTTVVNVAIPTISKSLDLTGVNNLQWLITAYGLTYAGFLFLGGRLADLFGRRRIFLLGTGLFGVASLLSGLSSASTVLILCRGFQGFGAALMTSAALSSLLAVFEEGKARNGAMVIWGAVVAGGLALGLVLGGVITQYVNWHWIFFVNVPVSALVLLATPFFLPKLEGHGVVSIKEFDLLGTVLVTSGLITLVYGLTQAPSYGWQDQRVIETLSVAVVLLGVFLVNEMRLAQPLLNLRLLAKGNVGTASLISMVVTGSNGAIFFFLSLYNQQVLGYTPLQSGLSVLPMIIVLVLTLRLVRGLFDKFGYKRVILAELLILALGLVTFIRLPVSGQYVLYELPSLVIISLGLPASLGLTLAAASGIQKEETGAVSGVLNTAQQIGGPLVLGILATIAATYSISSSSVTANLNAAVNGIHAAFIASALFVLVAVFLCTILIKPSEPDNNPSA